MYYEISAAHENGFEVLVSNSAELQFIVQGLTHNWNFSLAKNSPTFTSFSDAL